MSSKEELTEMYNKDLEKDVRKMFRELKIKTNEIIESSNSMQIATERISDAVSSKIAAESEGYIVDMYASLVSKIKSEDYFKDPDHLNAFYRLNLRDSLNEKYHFDIQSLDAYKKGIQYKEINAIYASLAASAGTLAIGGILKYVILTQVSIPIAVIIAGAVAAGIAAYLTIPAKNKKEYSKAVDKYLNDLENGILDWLTDIDEYFDEQIRSLYKA